MGAGLLPRRFTGRAEIAMLAAYGVVAAYAFGLLMNLSVVAVRARHRGARPRPGCRSCRVTRWSENLHRFLVYTLITSTGSFDTGRAITNAVAIVVLGPAVLTTLRRAARRVVVTGSVEKPLPRAAGAPSVGGCRRAREGGHDVHTVLRPPQRGRFPDLRNLLTDLDFFHPPSVEEALALLAASPMPVDSLTQRRIRTDDSLAEYFTTAWPPARRPT